MCHGDAGGWLRTKIHTDYDYSQTTEVTSVAGKKATADLTGAMRWNTHMIMRFFSKLLDKDHCYWILGFHSHREHPLGKATSKHVWFPDLPNWAFRHGKFTGYILNPGLATSNYVKQGHSDLRWAHGLQLFQDLDHRVTVTDLSRFDRGTKDCIRIDMERNTSWKLLWKPASKKSQRASVIEWKNRRDRERSRRSGFEFIVPPAIAQALAVDEEEDHVAEEAKEDTDEKLANVGDLMSSGSDGEEEEKEDEE